MLAARRKNCFLCHVSFFLLFLKALPKAVCPVLTHSTKHWLGLNGRFFDTIVFVILQIANIILRKYVVWSDFLKVSNVVKTLRKNSALSAFLRNYDLIPKGQKGRRKTLRPQKDQVYSYPQRAVEKLFAIFKIIREIMSYSRFFKEYMMIRPDSLAQFMNRAIISSVLFQYIQHEGI
jgi:hypothetical protein